MPSPPLPSPVSLDGIIDDIKTMQEAFSVCENKPPLIDFADGTPPLLDYNLPQSTAFTTYGRIAVPIDNSYFKAFTKIPPTNNYFDVVQTMTTEQVFQLLNPYVATQSPIVGTFIPTAAQAQPYHVGGIRSDVTYINRSLAQAPATRMNVAAEPQLMTVSQPRSVTSPMAELAKQGLRPILMNRINNRGPIVKYVIKPPTPVPRIAVVEEYTTSSFLGNYGAGRTVKTFTLLPGERTTISMRTYKDMVSTRDAAQNILDSFSDSSATELDNLMQVEQGNMNSTSDTSSGAGSSFSTHTDAQNSSSSWNVSANLSFGGFGVGGGYGQSNSDASTNANGWNNSASYGHTGARSSNINTVSNAINKHVQNSNSNRQININTSTSDTASSGEEDSTVRELVNYNKSRVLNFVFRQLLQEYTIITAITNLKFVYTNGYPESFTVVDLNNLDNMLLDLIMDAPAPADPESYRNAVRCSLLQNYCQIMDYQDAPKNFLDRVTVNAGTCLTQWIPNCTPKAETYWRIPKTLSETYDPLGANITVKGIILNVQKETLQTSSVIADALLGRGEALDCFNQNAQSADTMAAYISNMSAMQRLEDNVQTSSVNLDLANQQLDLGDQQIQLAVKQVEMSDMQIAKMDNENQVIAQQISVVDGMADSVTKATNYKKVFGQCCDSPQYTGGCGCGNCTDTDTP